MSWFWLSLIALLCWSGSDLFSKLGCADSRDKYSHLKMVTAVGVVMGLHAAYEVFIDGVEISLDVIITYLPVSALYILSMAIGYLGLRYIELSISSPICNSSGALVAILCICTGQTMFREQYIAVALICIGVIALGIVEMTEDDSLRQIRQEKSNYKYTKSIMALLLPVIYCLLDALGTFADDIVLEKLSEDSANVAYELTFLVCGIICFIYVKLIKKQKYLVKAEAPKYIGGIFETAGQLAYIYAIGGSGNFVGAAAAMICSYCAVSVLWSRIFLKEKLSWKHYASIAVAVAGIIILGIFDEA